MGFLSLKTLVLLNLSVLLLSCLSVLGSYESVMSIAQTADNLLTQSPAQAPAQPPVQPPSYAPTQVPIYAPTQPPSSAPGAPAPWKPIAVQGVVYCKNCKYVGINNLTGAKPLFGAVVRLQCNITRIPLVRLTKTDKKGSFFIPAPKTVPINRFQKCKVSIISSPLSTCKIPTNLHNGLLGEFLNPFNKPPESARPIEFNLFNIGPFAFEPSRKVPCLR